MENQKALPDLSYSTTCFLGLLFETHVCEYELDVYGFVSSTRYKYILIKNDHH